MTGGATTPAPEASPVAGVPPCLKLSPAAQSAGLFSGKSEWWTPARLEAGKRLYATDPRRGWHLLALVNAIDADSKPPVPNWSSYRSRMTFEKVARHPDATAYANSSRIRATDDPLVVAIRKCAARGLSIQRTADELGVKFGAVQRIAKRYAIGRAVPQGPHDEVRAMAARGLTSKQIAAELSCHERTAKRWLREAGVHSRRRGRPPIWPPRERAAPAAARGAKAPTQPRAAPMFVRAEKPAPPAAQTVEEFLAMGGQITRCPAVAVAPTQAEISAEDLAAVQAIYAARQPTGNWRQQRAAFFNARAKR